MDMTMASTWIRSEWAKTTGRATRRGKRKPSATLSPISAFDSHPGREKWCPHQRPKEEKKVGEGGRWGGAQRVSSRARKRTYAHDDEEAGQEASEVEDGGAGALDEVVRVCAATTDPVGHGGENVGGDDKQWVVDAPEGA